MPLQFLTGHWKFYYKKKVCYIFYLKLLNKYNNCNIEPKWWGLKLYGPNRKLPQLAKDGAGLALTC